MAREYTAKGCTYINQDAQGREHLRLFEEATEAGKDICVDRMGFNKSQRDRYLNPAKAKATKLKLSYSISPTKCV